MPPRKSKISKRGPPDSEDASELKLGEHFNDAGCLMNLEVQYLLAQRPNDEGRPSPADSEVYKKTYEYVQSYGSGSLAQTLHDAENIRSILERDPDMFKPFEVAQIANLSPGSAEEAKALIPSLASKVDDDALQNVLDELKVLKSYKGAH